MHIPPYHKKRSWQILLLGITIGVLVGYLVLVFMHGKMYEQVLTENVSLQTELNELKRQNEALLEDKEDLEENMTPVILSVSINFLNSKELHLDRLITHQLEDLVKHELDPIIGKKVDSVEDTDQITIDLIENKTYTIDDLSYELEVKKISITQKLKLSLLVKLP